jgi:hypothetical protein
VTCGRPKRCWRSWGDGCVSWIGAQFRQSEPL